MYSIGDGAAQKALNNARLYGMDTFYEHTKEIAFEYDLIYPSTEALNKMYNLEEITDVFFRDLFGGVNPLE